jgi:hypothetical protein
MQDNRSYGASLGGYTKVESLKLSLNLRNSGLDTSQPPDKIEEGMTPSAVNVRFDRGGVSPDFDVTPFGTASASAEDRTVMGMSPFKMDDLSKFTMRMRPTRWDRWNGANWLELGGVLTGTTSNRLYSLNYGNFFVAANGVDRLKFWDGTDVHAVADLDANAPIAKYITKIGNRIVAAGLTIAGGPFPNDVAWSGDGFPQEWTDPNLGAGGATVGPEGTDQSANIITGLSTLEGGGILYRERSIMIIQQTGIGNLPYRFSTLDFSHGCGSPYSIVSGGIKGGDYFLGSDFMVYYYDGRSLPQAIGDPIIDVLRGAIADISLVAATLDSRTQEYILAIPVDDSKLLKRLYAFNIREWQKSERLVWRERDLGAGYTFVGSGEIPTTTEPFIDEVDEITDTLDQLIDASANVQADERLLFGDSNGQAYFLDFDKPLAGGTWISKVLGDDHNRFALERVRLKASAGTESQIEVSVSNDGGLTFLYPKVYVIPATGLGMQLVSDFFGIEVTEFQLSLKILSGNPVVSQIAYTLEPHGTAS